MIETFDQKKLESTRELSSKALEKFRSYYAETARPAEVYGLNVLEYPDGRSVLKWIDERGLLSRDFLRNGNLEKRMQALGKHLVKLEHFDDDGKCYLTEKKLAGRTARTLEARYLPKETYRFGSAFYSTDASGRVKEALLENVRPRAEGFTKQNLSSVFKKVMDFQEGDQLGHLLAEMFGVNTRKMGIVPIDGKINQGEMRKLENRIQKLARSSDNVSVKVKVEYADANSTRPDRLTFEVFDDGKPVVFEDVSMVIYNHRDLDEVGRKNLDQRIKIQNTRLYFQDLHKAGLESGKMAMVVTFPVSLVENISDVLGGEVSVEEASLNIAKATGTAGLAGYGTGAAIHALSTAMTGSTKVWIQWLGGSALPASLVSLGVSSCDTIADFCQGKIGVQEFSYQMGHHIAQTGGSLAGGAAGSALAGNLTGTLIGAAELTAGTAGLAGAGISAGGLILGGIVGSAVCTELYKQAVEHGDEVAEILKNQTGKLVRGTVGAVRDFLPEKLEPITLEFTRMLGSVNLVPSLL